MDKTGSMPWMRVSTDVKMRSNIQDLVVLKVTF